LFLNSILIFFDIDITGVVEWDLVCVGDVLLLYKWVKYSTFLVIWESLMLFSA
jgi:hypothetical protein